MIKFTERYSKAGFWRKGFHSYAIEINGVDIESHITKIDGRWLFKTYGEFEEFSAFELMSIAKQIHKLNRQK